jgi:hypothetical protein
MEAEALARTWAELQAACQGYIQARPRSLYQIRYLFRIKRARRLLQAHRDAIASITIIVPT